MAQTDSQRATLNCYNFSTEHILYMKTSGHCN